MPGKLEREISSVNGLEETLKIPKIG